MTRVTFDLDLEDTKTIYKDALETMKYCADVIDSIKSRVLNGTNIDGFKVVPGKKTRTLTKEGLTFAINKLGEDKVYEKKPIGITKLEKLMDKQDISIMEASGLIEFKEGNPQVEVE